MTDTRRTQIVELTDDEVREGHRRMYSYLIEVAAAKENFGFPVHGRIIGLIVQQMGTASVELTKGGLRPVEGGDDE